jgi:ADP-ribose pyrophosphatase YjhB (NUDIX family)
MSSVIFRGIVIAALRTCRAVLRSRLVRYPTAAIAIHSLSNSLYASADTLPANQQIVILADQSNKFELDYDSDKYDGVIIKSEALPHSRDEFESQLVSSLKSWKISGKRGIWLKLPSDKLDLASTAVKHGFVMHHAEKSHLMLTHWLSEGENKLPANASHQVGIGCIVINEEGKILVVQERTGPLRGTGVWKMPTGLTDPHEDLDIAARREVFEETGVNTEFLGILCFRHAHKFLFDKSDLFFVCLMRPTSTKITIQESEIADCQWMDFEEYSQQALFQKSPLYAKLNEHIKDVVASSRNQKQQQQQHVVKVNEERGSKGELDEGAMRASTGAGSGLNMLAKFKLPIGWRPGSQVLFIPSNLIENRIETDTHDGRSS